MARKTAASLEQDLKARNQELEHLRKVYDGEKNKRLKINKRIKEVMAEVEEFRAKIRDKTKAITLLRKEIYDLKQLKDQRNRIQQAVEHMESTFKGQIKSESDELIPRLLAVLRFSENKINTLDEKLTKAAQERMEE